jgi:hypothetical protein
MKSILLVITTTVLSLLLANGYHTTSTTTSPPSCGSLHQVMHFYGYRPSELDTIVLAWYAPGGSFRDLLGSQNIFLNELLRDYMAKEDYFLSGHADPVTVFDVENPIDSIELWNDQLLPMFDSAAHQLCDVEVILMPAGRRVRFSNIVLGNEHTAIPTQGCDHRIISCRRDDGEQGYMQFVKQ